MFYTLWKGSANNQGDPIGCPADVTPNCVQQHQPIGQNNMRVESDFEEVNFQHLMMRLEQKYHRGPDCLKVGDEIGIMLVPSFSKLSDVVIDLKKMQDGFVFDLVLDNRRDDQAPLDGDVLRSTYPAPGVEGAPEDGCCLQEMMSGTSEDFGPPLAGDIFSRYTDWYCLPDPVRIGCSAGILKVVIKALPASPSMLSKTKSQFVVRANYDGVYSCCHAAVCGEDCGC